MSAGRPTGPGSASGPWSVTEIADAYLEDLARLDPDAAQAVGEDPEIQIPDLSDDAFAARADLARETVAALEVARAGTRGDHLLRSAMIERLGSDAALDEVGFTRRLLAPLATPVHGVRQVFDNLPSGTDEQVERVRANLAAVPGAYHDYLATLHAAADRGHVVARRQVLGVAEQCDGWVATGYYDGVAAGDERLVPLAREAAQATSWLAERLREELAPRAGETDAVGAELYTATSTAFLGTAVDLEETYAWGWSELTRLWARATELARESTGQDDVLAAAAILDARPEGRVPVAELEGWLQARLDSVTDAVDGVWFDLPAASRRVEARLTAAASGVMYYSPPDVAHTRPGRVWWTVPSGSTDVPTWREVSTVHHEGVPGHHLQHAITFGLADLHPWQRYLCQVHGYAEGWAHYAEQLAVDIGLATAADERLGVVLAQLWRACRIVIDLGLHLQLPVPAGNGLVPEVPWSIDLGVDTLQRLAGVDPETARFEVLRYLGWPGQALAFKVGARLWEQARDEARGREGADFSLRRFHARALGLGPMGLGPLRDALATIPDDGDGSTGR